MPTSFDLSWSALFKPGVATDYFNIDYPPVELQASGYSKNNALWLAELSRLIHRKRGNPEQQSPPGQPSRLEILNQVGLQETHFFYRQSTYAAILEPFNHSFAVLVFRGSAQLMDWLYNFNTIPVAWSVGGKVHWGFQQALATVWPEIEKALSQLTVPVFYTGHSLGAALATLAASLKLPHALYTFGSPRVGNLEFADTIKSIKTYRVVNHRDLVTKVPPSRLFSGFCHVGELYYMTSENQILVNPTAPVLANQTGGQEFTETTLSTKSSKPGFYLPEFLTDHAPVNYVARLERNWLQI